MARWPVARQGIPARVLVLIIVVLLGAAFAVVLTVRQSDRSGTPGPTGTPSYTDAKVVVSDHFDRTLAKGWGSADMGGTYRADSDDPLSVRDGHGRMAIERSGLSRTATLTSAQPRDLEASVDVTVPTTPLRGSGAYAAVHVRSDGAYFYRAALRIGPDRRAYLAIARFDGDPTRIVPIGREAVVAEKVKPGQAFHLTFRVVGVAPVQLSASVGLGPDAPKTWQLTAYDASASRLVAGGWTSLWGYVAKSSTGVTSLTFDNLNVTQLQAAAPAPASGAPAGQHAGSPAQSYVLPRRFQPATSQAALDAAVARAGGQERLFPVGARTLGSTRYPSPKAAIYVTKAAGPDELGTVAAPYASIQQAVDKAPAVATIVVASGSYHERVVLPRSKTLTLQPAPGAKVWLDGSSRVSGWSKVGGVWVVSGWSTQFDFSPTYTKGARDGTTEGETFVNPKHPMAAHPDQLWIGGVGQTQVGSRAQVERGTFYVDYGLQQLVFGTDPTGAKVRASTLDKGLTVLGRSDVIRGLGVRRYGTSVWQMGAVAVYGTDATLENVAVTDNATTGLSVLASGGTLRRVTAARNGLMGLHANRADGLRATALLVERNNLERFNRAPAAGGMKLTRSLHVRIAGSTFSDNIGHGVWFDQDCIDGTVVRSEFTDNTGAGLVVEISSRFELIANRVVGNHSHGLWLIDSDQVEVANNSLARNHERNLYVMMDGRGAARVASDRPRLSWVISDIAVYNNVFADGNGECVVCVQDYSHAMAAAAVRISFDHNYYQRSSAPRPTGYAVWPAAPAAALRLPSLTAFRTHTGQDVSSVLVDGGPSAVTGTNEIAAAVVVAQAKVARPLSLVAAIALRSATVPALGSRGRGPST